jgi:hypothetical protein
MSSPAGHFGGSTMGNFATNQQLNAGHSATSTAKSTAQKSTPAPTPPPTSAAVGGSSQAGPASVSAGASASK